MTDIGEQGYSSASDSDEVRPHRSTSARIAEWLIELGQLGWNTSTVYEEPQAWSDSLVRASTLRGLDTDGRTERERQIWRHIEAVFEVLNRHLDQTLPLPFDLNRTEKSDAFWQGNPTKTPFARTPRVAQCKNAAELISLLKGDATSEADKKSALMAITFFRLITLAMREAEIRRFDDSDAQLTSILGALLDIDVDTLRDKNIHPNTILQANLSKAGDEIKRLTAGACISYEQKEETSVAVSYDKPIETLHFFIIPGLPDVEVAIIESAHLIGKKRTAIPITPTSIPDVVIEMLYKETSDPAHAFASLGEKSFIVRSTRPATNASEQQANDDRARRAFHEHLIRKTAKQGCAFYPYGYCHISDPTEPRSGKHLGLNVQFWGGHSTPLPLHIQTPNEFFTTKYGAVEGEGPRHVHKLDKIANSFGIRLGDYARNRTATPTQLEAIAWAHRLQSPTTQNKIRMTGVDGKRRIVNIARSDQYPTKPERGAAEDNIRRANANKRRPRPVSTYPALPSEGNASSFWGRGVGIDPTWWGNGRALRLIRRPPFEWDDLHLGKSFNPDIAFAIQGMCALVAGIVGESSSEVGISLRQKWRSVIKTIGLPGEEYSDLHDKLEIRLQEAFRQITGVEWDPRHHPDKVKAILEAMIDEKPAPSQSQVPEEIRINKRLLGLFRHAINGRTPFNQMMGIYGIHVAFMTLLAEAGEIRSSDPETNVLVDKVVREKWLDILVSKMFPPPLEGDETTEKQYLFVPRLDGRAWLTIPLSVDNNSTTRRQRRRAAAWLFNRLWPPLRLRGEFRARRCEVTNSDGRGRKINVFLSTRGGDKDPISAVRKISRKNTVDTTTTGGEDNIRSDYFGCQMIFESMEDFNDFFTKTAKVFAQRGEPFWIRDIDVRGFDDDESAKNVRFIKFLLNNEIELMIFVSVEDYYNYLMDKDIGHPAYKLAGIRKQHARWRVFPSRAPTPPPS